MSCPNPNNRGFTLMELMAVMLIVSILFGIIFTGASYLFSAQEEKKLKLEIEAISLALEQFRSENEDYHLANFLIQPIQEGKFSSCPCLDGWM